MNIFEYGKLVYRTRKFNRLIDKMWARDAALFGKLGSDYDSDGMAYWEGLGSPINQFKEFCTQCSAKNEGYVVGPTWADDMCYLCGAPTEGFRIIEGKK